MLTILAKATVVAVFAVVVAFVGYVLWQALISANEQDKNGNGAQVEQQQNDSANKIASPSLPKSSADEKIATYTLALAVFTAFLVLTSAFQIVYLIRAEGVAVSAAQAAKNSADIANKSLIETQRPWLVITDISVSEIKRNGASIDITFTYTIKNLGKTPATFVRRRYETLDSVDFKAMSGVAASLEAGTRKAMTGVAAAVEAGTGRGPSYLPGMIIGPDQEKTLQKLTVSMNPAEKPYEPGTLLPVLFICVLYDAAGFDSPRVMLNAYRLNGTAPDGRAGLTTEFSSLQVYIKDLPLRSIRVTPIDRAREDYLSAHVASAAPQKARRDANIH
jgi:hypothetical protein